MKYGKDETPIKSKIKGDHFVGKFYIMFEDQYRKEQSKLVDSGLSLEEAKLQAPIILEAKEMLLKWENNDKDTVELWRKMNSWVYDGFDETYEKLNISFDNNYYESNTY